MPFPWAGLSGFGFRFHLRIVPFWQSVCEGLLARSAVHAAAPVGPLGAVSGEVGGEVGLHLVGIEPGPGVAPVAIDGALQIDLADPLERADEEGINGHRIAGVAGLDVALAELGAEAFEEADLPAGELDLAL